MINLNKKIYNSPNVERIELDNEISLTLDSFGSDPIEPIMSLPLQDFPTDVNSFETIGL